MPRSTIISRRTAFAGMGALTALAAGPALAKAPMLGGLSAVANRFQLGAFEVTTIFDGGVVLDGPHPIFGENAEKAEVQALAAAHALPTAKMEIGFTPTLVNTGAELILFDTGNGAARRPNAGLLRARLADAGYAPEDVDVVVLTHFHPDHIGGLLEDGAPAFPNARYVTGAAEYDFWTSDDRLSGPTEQLAGLVRSTVVPFAEAMRFVKPGEEIAPGIEAVDAFGHTPGHMAWHIENGGQRLLLTADTANHFVLSLQRPDWHIRFDMDKEKAVATRKRLFGMIAADKVPFIGYHMPFPALGYLQAEGAGFRFMAESYQFDVRG